MMVIKELVNLYEALVEQGKVVRWDGRMQK